MLLEFIAMIVAAIGTAGVLVAVNRLTGRRLPGWIVPAGAGAAMLAFAVWSEYSWFSRVAGQLPAGVEVVSAPAGTSPFRPWSYLFPLTERFVAVDRTNIVPHASAPGQRFLNVYWFERWAPTRVATVLVDCAGARGSELPAGADFPVTVILPDEAWSALPAADPVLRAACAEA